MTIRPSTVADPVQALRDQRARQLDTIDDVLRTAQLDGGRSLTPAERQRHDTAVATADALEDAIRTAGAEPGAISRSRFDAPNVNVHGSYSPGAGREATRSLDALLWATADSVPTGNGARNAVDQVLVRSDSADPGFLAPRIGEYRPEHREAVRTFQQTVAEMCVAGMFLDRGAMTSREGFQVARSHRLYADRWHDICRALDVDTTGEGADWVPTGIGASMHEKVRAMGKVAPLFQRIELPTNPWKWPIEGADASFYRVAEPTSDTATKVAASTPGTLETTFDAEIFGGRVLFSRSAEADSAVMIAKFTLDKLARAFVTAEEKAILDGDSDGTHQDADTDALGATDPRTAWNGLRKWALAQSPASATTTTAANLAAVRKLMGKWGVDPNDLAFIIGVSSLHALLADTNLLTVDKMGPNATILSGQIGSVYGVPVIVSEHVREDLNATGVNDGITATKTYLMAVHRPSWVIGQRMALDVAIDDSIYRETFQRVAIGFQREDFQAVTGASTDDVVALGYNTTSGS